MRSAVKTSFSGPPQRKASPIVKTCALAARSGGIDKAPIDRTTPIRARSPESHLGYAHRKSTPTCWPKRHWQANNYRNLDLSSAVSSYGKYQAKAVHTSLARPKLEAGRKMPAKQAHRQGGPALPYPSIAQSLGLGTMWRCSQRLDVEAESCRLSFQDALQEKRCGRQRIGYTRKEAQTRVQNVGDSWASGNLCLSKDLPPVTSDQARPAQ